MYYCLRCPPPSFVIIVFHYLLIHQFAIQLPSIRHLFRFEVAWIIFVWSGTSNGSAVWEHVPCMSSSCRRDDVGGVCLSIFHIYLCIATVSIEIARLTANSDSGPTFATFCVAAAAMLSRWPLSESSILFGSGAGLEEVVCSNSLKFPCALFTAEPMKGFYFPSLAALANCLATYTSLKVFFHAVQVCWSSGSFDHSLVSVS